MKLTIDKDGHVSHVKALNDSRYGFATEAERAIKGSPIWIPAKLHGEKIAYCFVQSITFQIQ